MEEIKTYNDNFNPDDFSDSMVAETLAEVGAPADTPAPAKPKGKKTVREGGKKVETATEGKTYIYLKPEGTYEEFLETVLNDYALLVLTNPGSRILDGRTLEVSVSVK